MAAVTGDARLQEQIRVAHDGSERRAKLVAHIGQEDAFSDAGGFSRDTGTLELLGGVAAVAEVAHDHDNRYDDHDNRQGAGQADGQQRGHGAPFRFTVPGFQPAEFVFVEVAHVVENLAQADIRLLHRRLPQRGEEFRAGGFGGLAYALVEAGVDFSQDFGLLGIVFEIIA